MSDVMSPQEKARYKEATESSFPTETSGGNKKQDMRQQVTPETGRDKSQRRKPVEKIKKGQNSFTY